MNQPETGIARRYLEETRYRRRAMGEKSPAYPRAPLYKEYPDAAQRLSLDPEAGRRGADLWQCLAQRRSQLVDLADDERENAYSYSADVALHYTPQRSPYGVSLRYTFFHQTQDAGVAEPAFAEFTRNAILLEVHGRWPSQQAATYPQRDPVRVDGSDITRMGAEQAAEEPRRPQ